MGSSLAIRLRRRIARLMPRLNAAEPTLELRERILAAARNDGDDRTMRSDGERKR